MSSARGDLSAAGTPVYDRIRATAKAAKQDVPFAFQRFALERLLARLEDTPHAGGYAVKGGMLMLCLPGAANRPTEDLDLSSSRDIGLDELVAVLREVCAAAPRQEDGLTFELDEGKCRTLKVDSPHPTVRAMIDAQLHNRYGAVRIRLMLDVSQGEGIHPELRRVRLPQTCKGFEPPEVPCYPWETVVAEKIHAIVCRGATNTRMKDYYDLVNIAANTDIPAERFAEALVVTFSGMSTPIETEPYGLTGDFAEDKEGEWKAFCGRRKLGHAPATMAEAVERVRGFAAPLLARAAEMERAAAASPAPF